MKACILELLRRIPLLCKYIKLYNKNGEKESDFLANNIKVRQKSPDFRGYYSEIKRVVVIDCGINAK